MSSDRATRDRLASDARDLIAAIEAANALEDGFRGMGINILQEKAGMQRHYARHVLRGLVASYPGMPALRDEEVK